MLSFILKNNVWKAVFDLKYIFTDEDKARQINVIFIEEDNVLVKGEFITKEEDGFIIAVPLRIKPSSTFVINSPLTTT